MIISIKLLNKDAIIPKKATSKSSGYDLYSTIDHVLQPGEIKLIPLGFATTIPDGYEVQIRSRSGLSLKYGVVVANSPGTIDADFSMEWGVILTNISKQPFNIEKGTRIAQAVVQKVPDSEFVEIDSIQETDRKGGFGHTGVK